MSNWENSKARCDAARAALATTAAALDPAWLREEWSDFMGNPGIDLRANAPETEATRAFSEARIEYIRAMKAEHGYVYGPMLRDYYNGQ